MMNRESKTRSCGDGEPRTENRELRTENRRAFSLVEVTLALGIIGFAFVAIFGMLPVALETSRHSIDKTRTAQIAQRLFAEAQQTPFDRLGSLYGQTFWFDGDGEEIASETAASSTGPAGYVYSATLVQSPSTPGLGLSATRTRVILVKIAKNRVVTALAAGEKPLVQEAFALADVKL